MGCFVCSSLDGRSKTWTIYLVRIKVVHRLGFSMAGSGLFIMALGRMMDIFHSWWSSWYVHLLSGRKGRPMWGYSTTIPLLKALLSEGVFEREREREREREGHVTKMIHKFLYFMVSFCPYNTKRNAMKYCMWCNVIKYFCKLYPDGFT